MAEGEYSHGNSAKSVKDYAWLSTNAGSKTHPVGQKKSMLYNGKPIYDLHGNVWEWQVDWYRDKLTGGFDPQRPRVGTDRVFRGGSWGDAAKYLCSWCRVNDGPTSRTFNVGFRVLRKTP